MSDSNSRFDPYTGDPIPDDTSDNNIPTPNPDGQNDSFTQNTNSVTPDQNNAAEFTDSTWNTGSSASSANGNNLYHTSNPYYSQPHNVNQAYDSAPNTSEQQDHNNAPDFTNDKGRNPYPDPSDINFGYNNADTYTSGSPQQSEPYQTQYNPYTGQPISNTAPDNKKQDNKAHNFSIVALACGIGSIVTAFLTFCCCPFLSIIAGIVGIVFGVLAKNSFGERSSMAFVGIITSIIGLVLTVLIVIFGLVLCTSGSNSFWDEFDRYMENGMNDNNGFNFNSDSSDDYHDYSDDLYHYDGFY